MPNRDGTGPEGKGLRTGRGLGNCAPTNNDNEPITNDGKGIPKRDGSGQGRRLNRGRGGCNPTREQGRGRN